MNIKTMKLKPVTFVNTKYNKFRQNTSQQIMLLSALKITQDPKKLKQMIGVRTVAEVFRTLDKLALRKEYHRELEKCGVDFGFIIKGIKQECELGEKSADRLKGYQILLKSLGMDKYDDNKEGGTGGWEEALQKVIKDKESSPKLLEDKDANGDYEVIQPVVPESVKIRKALETKEGKGLYD